MKITLVLAMRNIYKDNHGPRHDNTTVKETIFLKDTPVKTTIILAIKTSEEIHVLGMSTHQ